MISSLKSRFAKNSAAFLAIKVGAMALGYLNIIFISRFFGTEALGIFSVLVSAVAISGNLATFGINTNIVKKVSAFRKTGREKRVRPFYLSSLKSAGILLLTLALISAFLVLALELFFPGSSKYQKLILSAAFLSVPFCISIINSGFAAAHHKLGWAAFSKFAFVLPALSGLIIYFFFSKQVSETAPAFFFALGLIIVSAISFVPVIKLMQKPSAALKMKSFRVNQILKQSFPFMVIALSTVIINQADRLILSGFSDNSSVGIYHALHRTAALLSLSLIAVSSSSAPKFSEFYSTGNIRGLIQFLKKMMLVLSVVSVFIFLLLFIFAQQIFALIGIAISDFYTEFVVLSLANLFSVLSGPNAVFLQMTGYEKFVRNFSLIAAVVFVLLDAVFVYFYGISGAVWVVFSLLVLKNLTFLIKIKKEFGFLYFSVIVFKSNNKA